MSFNKLPLEIYLCIFSYLPKTTLAECQTVCKACQPAATQILCEHVYFSKALLEKIRSKNPTQCLFTRTLDIRLYNLNTDSIRDDLSTLFWTLPRLRKIKLSLCSYYDKLCTFLSGMTQIEKTHMSFVEEIQLSNIDRNPTANDLYLTLNYQLSNSIKYLSISGIRDCCIKENIMSVLDYLKHFKHLRKLVISPSMTAHQSNSRNNFNIFDIFSICPYLEEFDFETYQNLREIEPEKSLQDNTLAQSLKYFSFKAPNLPSTHLPFLLDVILPKISTFKFRLTEASIDDTILNSHLTKIIQHLEHIKSLKISSTPLVRNALRNTAILTNIWKCVNAIKRHHPSLTTTLKIYAGKHHLTGLTSLELDPTHQKLYLIVHVYATDPCSYSSCLVDSLKSEMGSHVLNEVYMSDSIASFIPGDLVEHILSNCHKLNLLSFSSVESSGGIEIKSSPEDTIPTKKMKSITLTTARINDHMIKTLTSKLPHIQELYFDDCLFHLDEHMNTFIDLGGLDQLELLQFNTSTNTVFRQKSIYFELEMKDGACMVYKSVAKSRREWLPFELVTPKYLSSYKRFQSRNSNVITIKCPRIDTIVFLTDPQALLWRFEFHPWLDYQKSLEE